MGAAKKVLVVTGSLVAVRVKAGDIRQLYRGDVVGDDVSEESVEHLKSLGYLEETDGPTESDDSDDQPKGYVDQKVGELKAEIETRNAAREDDAKISTDGNNKAALVAALEADDAAQAEK
jgi:hypothetical protein